ncbi:hypothetical protein PHYBOEH_010439 [Phytophthora boehmeriae]|uniref:Uncharacterized protein n=1 Tax=Phytophthora boehmeriae TaxID=109152 RepID=A0A8T1WY35_9STRA|nr:hypothetical protein PHYBOEH_010439 [Phytophthora boehmeriae]
MSGLVRALIVAVLAFAVTVAALDQDTDLRRLESSLVDAPSVKLHVTLKRKSMKLHGHSKFEVSANPVVSSDGKSVIYDGYATFVEDDTVFKYFFVGGEEYMVEIPDSNSTTESAEQIVQCLPSGTPFGAVVTSLNEAVPIPSASVGGEPVKCSSGNLFKTTFSGTQFAICASGSAGFTAFGSDMTVKVKYLDERVKIPEPKLSEGAAPCPAAAKPVAANPIALALMTGDKIPESTSRKLKAAEHMAMEASSCQCKSKPRPCVFFHGLGNANEDAELQDSNSNWGYAKLQGHTPCCSTVKYANLNTVDYGWTDDTLQKKVCNHALSIGNSPESTIENTIIVTHSMGGLMLAGALASGKCALGSSSTWIALSPPMTGSMSSDYIQDFCNGQIQGDFVADLMMNNRCPASAAIKTTSYENEKYAASLDEAYDAAQEAYRKHVSAAMCSTSYVGNISKYQAKYMLCGSKFPHKSSKNDGLVEFHSCAGGLPASKFNRNYMHPFYKAELNHVDTAFKTGDGIFKETVKPIKWFECLL